MKFNMVFDSCDPGYIHSKSREIRKIANDIREDISLIESAPGVVDCIADALTKAWEDGYNSRSQDSW